MGDHDWLEEENHLYSGEHPIFLHEDRAEEASDWDCSTLESGDIPGLVKSNAYIRKLYAHTGLHIKQEDNVLARWRDSRELGLFRLFLTPSISNALHSCLCKRMSKLGKEKVTAITFNAYLGLEIAISLVNFNTLAEYWCEDMFTGHPDFKAVMSRNDFNLIRQNILFYPEEELQNMHRTKDPLWTVRSLIGNFQKACADIAVPMGPTALDENTVRTKARISARSYIKGKPDPYGIRFYALCGWKYPYLFSLWDKSSGNHTGTPGVRSYVDKFGLQVAYEKLFQIETFDKDSPSALWLMQMAHMTACHADQSGTRVVFMDNYYTRHSLGEAVKTITNGEVKITGTVRLNFIDAKNKSNVQRAIAAMKGLPHGSWKLVAAYNVIPDLAKKHQELNKKGKIVVGLASTPAESEPTPVAETKSEKAGYILFTDSKLVVFYTNDLAKTPSVDILDGADREALECVHGTADLHRWVAVDQCLNRKTIAVPAPIVAYNMFIKPVDRMDQRRSTNPMQRREKNIGMSIFTMICDLSMHNAYMLYQNLFKRGKVPEENGHLQDYREFKRRIAEALVQPQRASRIKKQEQAVVQRQAAHTRVQMTIGMDMSSHMLVETRNKTSTQCILCAWRCREDERPKETIYGCTECKKGFHVMCFSAFHHRHALRGHHEALHAIIQHMNKDASIFKRPNKNIGGIDEIKLPNPAISAKRHKSGD